MVRHVERGDMTHEDRAEEMHPMEGASLLARLTWHYLTPLLRKGVREGVRAEDVHTK